MENKKTTLGKPIVYSCSGASSAAQVCNEVALRLDHQGFATMSCIAGVGGDVPPLVALAKSGRPILALDGCALRCVQHILNRHGITADTHIDLADLGIKKNLHQRYDPDNADEIFLKIKEQLSSLK